MTNAFRDIAKQKPASDEGQARLFCTTPGCGHKWSVNVDRPLCSFHAWGQSTEYFSFASAALTDDQNLDGRRWARRIVAAAKAGSPVRPFSLALATASLPRQRVANQQGATA